MEELSDSHGVGCYWGHMFAGALSYADDIVILAPCASALRRMLDICSLYAHDHGLLFNASKTQLICFCSCKNCRFLPLITFNNTALPYKNEVIHLGHVLLNDGPDVTRALKDLNRKANCSLCTFYFTDSYVKCFLVKLYCLALYGCCLWHLGSKSLYSLQTALNKIMRKVWHLPSRCHVPIVHCVAKTTNILRMIYSRFIKFCNSGLMSNTSFVSRIFHDSRFLAYTFVGHNFMFGHLLLQNETYTDHVTNVAQIIDSIRYVFGPVSPFEELIFKLSCI